MKQSARQYIITVFVFALALCTAGCLSVPNSPSPRFYTLQPVQQADQMTADAQALSGVFIGIGPVTLPGYLDRPQIVTVQPERTVEFAQFDRWAESLDDQLARVIAKDLSLMLPQTHVEIFPWNSSILPIKYQVLMEVISLECERGGSAVMLAQWSVFEAQEKRMLVSRRQEYRAPVSGTGYPDIVEAVSSLAEYVSRDIAAALAKAAMPVPTVVAPAAE